MSIDVSINERKIAVEQPVASLAGDRRSLHIPYASIQYLVLTSDFLLILLAGLIGAVGYQFLINGELGDVRAFASASAFAGVLYVLIGRGIGFYTISSIFSPRGEFKKIVCLWALVGLLLTFFLFILKAGSEISRGSMLSLSIVVLLVLLNSRIMLKKVARRWVTNGFVRGRRVVLVGSADELSVLRSADVLKQFGLSEVARVSLSTKGGSHFSLQKYEIDALDSAISAARQHCADEIALAFPWTDTRRLEWARHQLRSSPLPVQLLPDRRIRAVADNPSFTITPSFSVEVQRGPLSGLERLGKRSLDVAGASIGLVMLTPLLLMVAVAIKLDSSGPVLFRQRRNGFNQSHFRIFKFRTMTVMEDGGSVVQAQQNDPRVTNIGRFLRRSSIDELPQLLNVLRGDMSLVGPRPHALAHDTYYGDMLSDYAFRHHVKPGITGWAQIHGHRGETKHVDQMKQRVEYDLWYINNWNMRLDLKVIWKTAFELRRSRNAY